MQMASEFPVCPAGGLVSRALRNPSGSLSPSDVSQSPRPPWASVRLPAFTVRFPSTHATAGKDRSAMRPRLFKPPAL